MSRPAVFVRRVDRSEPDLFSQLVGLVSERWAAGADRAGDGGSDCADPGTPAGAAGLSGVGASAAARELRRCPETRAEHALGRPGVTAFLAVADGEPVGYLFASTQPTTIFDETPCLSIEDLYVTRRVRKRGVARALLSALAAHAERQGVEQLATTTPSMGREANRFFARLGFTPAVVRRISTTHALHRRLSGSGHPSAIEQVLQRRRARVRHQPESFAR